MKTVSLAQASKVSGVKYNVLNYWASHMEVGMTLTENFINQEFIKVKFNERPEAKSLLLKGLGVDSLDEITFVKDGPSHAKGEPIEIVKGGLYRLIGGKVDKMVEVLDTYEFNGPCFIMTIDGEINIKTQEYCEKYLRARKDVK